MQFYILQMIHLKEKPP